MLAVVGWILITVVLGGVFLCAVLFTYLALVNGPAFSDLYRLHLETRNTPPAPGQVWVSDGKRLHIVRVDEQTVAVSYTTDRNEEVQSMVAMPTMDWTGYVYDRRMFLCKDTSPIKASTCS